MGYDVALMADSTSRWAEAMREMSGRLEEMPGEEGYPAYLGSRTAGFYERTGIVSCLGKEDRTGSLTAIGAVSPPGGDFSEPVTQNTLRVTKVFWALDAKLAYKRHFPAINWLQSYSLYLDNLDKYYATEVAEDFCEKRDKIQAILQEESKLEEIVRLVGTDALSPREQLTMEIARMAREDFLYQNAFDKVDAYTSLKKQYKLLDVMIHFMEEAEKVIGQEDFEFSRVRDLPVKDEIAKASFIPEDEVEEKYAVLKETISNQIGALKTQNTSVKKEEVQI
ncbi:V-type ATP synthase subunit A, partial [Candidatus Peregrinibacteria bacterium]|nr:V-type ATP synthase subunit A [Candidatus Peregrinibacteria bacterium]